MVLAMTIYKHRSPAYCIRVHRASYGGRNDGAAGEYLQPHCLEMFAASHHLHGNERKTATVTLHVSCVLLLNWVWKCVTWLVHNKQAVADGACAWHLPVRLCQSWFWQAESSWLRSGKFRVELLHHALVIRHKVGV
jgi:hypothetical protein